MFIVEKIIGHRFELYEGEFEQQLKIYWKDYPLEKDKTWEPYLEIKKSVPYLVN